MRLFEWRRALTRRMAAPLACCALAACGSGDGFVGSGGVIGPLEPNFNSIQANVFDQYCEHCHSGANAPVGLRLDAANSYASLVGVPSGERAGVLRVAPGDHHGGAAAGQAARHAQTDAAVAAGHDRDPAGKVEECHGTCPCCVAPAP